MLDEVLKFDMLGNKEEIEFLLFDALPLSNGKSLHHLRQYSFLSKFTIARSFDGIVKLLEFIDYIEIDNYQRIFIEEKNFNPIKSIKNKFFEDDKFAVAILNSLRQEKALHIFINPDCVKLVDAGNGICLKDNLIPYKFFAFRNLLLALGFFKRDIVNPNNILVNDVFIPSFKLMVVDFLKRQPKKSLRKKITIEELKQRLRLQEEHGIAAEKFVVQYEYLRLFDHPYKAEIERISDFFCNAGYDIESFNSIESLFIDRFIEVKSFSSSEPIFFWSQNEVDTAQELGEKYFLYIVDLNKIYEKNYHPSIYQNPCEHIFDNANWIKEVDCWKVYTPKTFGS